MMTVCGDLSMMGQSTYAWLAKVKLWAKANKPPKVKPKVTGKK